QPVLHSLMRYEVSRNGVLQFQPELRDNRVPPLPRGRTLPCVGLVGPRGRRKWLAVYQRTHARDGHEERIFADAVILDGDALGTVCRCHHERQSAVEEM